MQTYDTLTEALNGLKEQGFTRDYNLQPNHLLCTADKGKLSPDQFEIVQVYRFEGMTDPDDEAVLYAIEETNGKRGTLVDAYGAYSDSLSADMVSKLRIKPNP